MSWRSPAVFKQTVFPPVFGPVITSIVKSEPSRIVIGTTLSPGIKGCLASRRESARFSEKRGLTAFIPRESFAFANTKSRCERSRIFSESPSVCGLKEAESLSSSFSISLFSSALSSRISLFRLTML